MKYFLKYIPVDFEIRLGTRIRLKDGRLGVISSLGLDTGEQFMKLDTGEEVDSMDFDYDVVKLFLCTKEISIGDTIKTKK